ncbi:MAG: hypothetical protein CMC05_11735 [Flavobacteriaceae bacterium]|uniref:hypothetical protein n=1 Tax=Winogradskyella poriferorum TaxID=307627 RepID=UPI000C8CE641|nr:hypothetical protein [Flavobacteriaceae bacterium]
MYIVFYYHTSNLGINLVATRIFLKTMEKEVNDIPKNNKIFISIDHLSVGTYQLHILLENKVVKTFILNKEALQ